jgi:EmrB/QacA subfamily drug resistance transporter
MRGAWDGGRRSDGFGKRTMQMSARLLAARRSGRWGTVLAVAGLMLALFLVALDQTIVGTALPKIVAELNGFERYARVTTAYLLASTSMIPVIGKLGDIYGRKWFIVSGIVVFLIGSALSGAAWGIDELILFRGIQGLGAGMIFSNVFTSIADIFPDPANRARYQGVFSGVFALSSVVGPTLGGWITDNLDWRWIFYVNLPLGVFSLIALPFVLPQSGRRRRVRIDYFGAATITASVVALLLSLSWVGHGDTWASGRVIAGFVISAILLAIFVPIELRAPEPVIPLSLFRSRVFTSASLLMFLVGIGMFGIILYTPLFVQGVLGKTATNSGTVLTPLVFSMAVVSVIGGQIIARVRRVKPFTLFGTVVMSCGVYLLTTLDAGSTPATVALYLAVTGLGLGWITPTSNLAVQSTVDRGLLGVATSAAQFIRSIGATVGTAVIGSIVTKGYTEGLVANAPPQAPQRLISALENPQALVSEGARAALTRAASALPGGERLVAQVIQTARESLSNSIHGGFVFVLFASGFAIIAAVLMKNVRLQARSTETAVPGDRAERDQELLVAALALIYLSRRIESANGSSPHLIRTALKLVSPDGGISERALALRANEEVLKPLSQVLLLNYLRQNHREAAIREAANS